MATHPFGIRTIGPTLLMAVVDAANRLRDDPSDMVCFVRRTGRPGPTYERWLYELTEGIESVDLIGFTEAGIYFTDLGADGTRTVQALPRSPEQYRRLVNPVRDAVTLGAPFVVEDSE
jgi:hypothetical protein